MKKLITQSVGAFINVTAVVFPKWNADFSFNLLCKVKRVGISEKGKEFFEDAEQTFLEVDGHSAVLHKWGQGPKTVLFLHGWLSNSQRWRNFVDHLDLSEYTVYAVDAPGHGMAKGKYLNLEVYRQSLRQALELTGPVDTLVCHSLGSLATAYAHLEADGLPIKKYVITGAPSGMDAIFVYFEELLGLSNKAIANLEGKINSILKLPHGEVSMKHFFKKVQDPLLVIHERNDRVTPFRAIESALNGNKVIQTYFTEGNDHNLKTPDVIDRVITFIKN
ncbi:alpha/beta hydrolase [Aureisphaera galaxeae]|uniref:alpha/beta hydrolase n=1 Tax=Aureisphaera galaxeae TaxID=1538023 RepID=UPI002350C0A4|nr:alpha/beta hydrolase [Aureisphaera galaxeae]MDC8005330.1 alpha/beta hydrolase [Aureisphaera galaxeae]